MTKKLIAVLDDNGFLVGSKSVAQSHEGLEFGDLPINGTYKWDEAAGTFHPIGHGFGKVKNGVPPFGMEYIIALMIENWGKPELPHEVIEWADWYNEDLRRREEERSRVRR